MSKLFLIKEICLHTHLYCSRLVSIFHILPSHFPNFLDIHSSPTSTSFSWVDISQLGRHLSVGSTSYTSSSLFFYYSFCKYSFTLSFLYFSTFVPVYTYHPWALEHNNNINIIRVLQSSSTPWCRHSPAPSPPPIYLLLAKVTAYLFFLSSRILNF